MLSLPKVKKSAKRALSRLEKAQKVVVGVALVLGVSLAALPAKDVNAAAAPTVNAQTQLTSGALLLTAPHLANTVVADHYSHMSHSSHSSHSSHYSHYSSRS